MLAPRLLEGLKVLVVEDNLLLAEVTKILLEDSGCEVVGPAGWLQRGLELAEHERLNGAILDINLHGEMSFPIAEALSARGVPFVPEPCLHPVASSRAMNSCSISPCS